MGDSAGPLALSVLSAECLPGGDVDDAGRIGDGRPAQGEVARLILSGPWCGSGTGPPASGHTFLGQEVAVGHLAGDLVGPVAPDLRGRTRPPARTLRSTGPESGR
jgi:hypothetical protein